MNQSSPSPIALFLQQDHVDIDAVLSKVDGQLAQRMVPGARESFRRFVRLLNHHLFMEERILFDVLSAAPQSAEARISELHQEHDHVRDLVRKTTASLECGDSERAGAAALELREFLQSHEDRELRELEATLAALPHAEMEGVLHRLRSSTEPSRAE